MATAGVVVIGRNEGERLKRCLESVVRCSDVVVYVDSGSSDDSVAVARARGVTVVQLDGSAPYTAARARNAGCGKLCELRPELEYVQFVDGDCEMVSGWLECAGRFLDEHPEVAVVSGRLRERHPKRSVYNLLCDVEWDVPVGEAKASGGNALVRARAFRAARGFREDVIAGEEPELGVRLRRMGWRIWRIEDEMALHDASMSRFGQWWKRALRNGYAIAQGMDLHGAPPERHCVREARSAWLWGMAIPAGVAALAALYGPAAVALLLIYPAQVVRLALRGSRSARENWWYAGFLVLGKFPEMLGQLEFHYFRLCGKGVSLIERKGSAGQRS